MSPIAGFFLQATPAPNIVRTTIEGAIQGLGLSADLSSLTTDLVMWVGIATVIVLVVQVAMLYTTWLERKVVGRMQDRLGANRVGKNGLLQPLADMIKMLTKEDITPEAAHRSVFNLSAILIVPPSILVFAVVPVGIGLVATDLSVGFLFFIAIASTAVVPIFMAGWGSRNKYAIIGSMRAVAQIVSYEIPQVLAVVGVLMLAGSLSTQGITMAQGSGQGEAGWPGMWFIFLQPIAFLIFLMATAAEIERTPFDIPEAESEIIAGYHTEYAGIKFGMFYLSLYFFTIASAALGSILFLGGWQAPFGLLNTIPGTDFSLGWFWMSIKTFILVFVFIWLRGTLPRLRSDQLMGFAWKILVPLTLVNLLATGLIGKLTQGQSGIIVFIGFLIANALMVLLLLGLVSWWRGQRAASAIRFDAPAGFETPALEAPNPAGGAA
jgi:NADH-quinone oxidoreductase subunit H